MKEWIPPTDYRISEDFTPPITKQKDLVPPIQRDIVPPIQRDLAPPITRDTVPPISGSAPSTADITPPISGVEIAPPVTGRYEAPPNPIVTFRKEIVPPGPSIAA